VAFNTRSNTNATTVEKHTMSNNIATNILAHS